MERIELTPLETAALSPKVARLEGMSIGYAQGIEAAKRIMIEDFLKNRKVNDDAIAQQKHAAAGHAPDSTAQPVPPIQSAGSGDESERAGIAASVPNADAYAHLRQQVGGFPGQRAAGSRMGSASPVAGTNAIDPGLFPIRGTGDIQRAFANASAVGDDGAVQPD